MCVDGDGFLTALIWFYLNLNIAMIDSARPCSIEYLFSGKIDLAQIGVLAEIPVPSLNVLT